MKLGPILAHCIRFAALGLCCYGFGLSYNLINWSIDLSCLTALVYLLRFAFNKHLITWTFNSLSLKLIAKLWLFAIAGYLCSYLYVCQLLHRNAANPRLQAINIGVYLERSPSMIYLLILPLALGLIYQQAYAKGQSAYLPAILFAKSRSKGILFGFNFTSVLITNMLIVAFMLIINAILLNFNQLAANYCQILDWSNTATISLIAACVSFVPLYMVVKLYLRFGLKPYPLSLSSSSIILAGLIFILMNFIQAYLLKVLPNLQIGLMTAGKSNLVGKFSEQVLLERFHLCLLAWFVCWLPFVGAGIGRLFVQQCSAWLILNLGLIAWTLKLVMQNTSVEHFNLDAPWFLLANLIGLICVLYGFKDVVNLSDLCVNLMPKFRKGLNHSAFKIWLPKVLQSEALYFSGQFLFGLCLDQITLSICAMLFLPWLIVAMLQGLKFRTR